MIATGLECLRAAVELARKRIAERKQRRDRYAVAEAFNRLWCYRPYPSRTRWMCPLCNTAHDRLDEVSAFTGLQYPKCCDFDDGHRLYHELYATKGATRG